MLIMSSTRRNGQPSSEVGPRHSNRWHRRTALRGLVLCALVASFLPTSGPAAAQDDPSSPDCVFQMGFATLRDQIGSDVVGDCIENEHSSQTNDAEIQATTNGLLLWRKADNWTAFTNGSLTWVNGPDGVQARGNDDRFPWEVAEAVATPAVDPASADVTTDLSMSAPEQPSAAPSDRTSIGTSATPVPTPSASPPTSTTAQPLPTSVDASVPFAQSTTGAGPPAPSAFTVSATPVRAGVPASVPAATATLGPVSQPVGAPRVATGAAPQPQVTPTPTPAQAASAQTATPVYPLADATVTVTRGGQTRQFRPVKTVRGADGRLVVADRIIVGFKPSASSADIALAHQTARSRGVPAAASVRSLGGNAQLVDTSGASQTDALAVYRGLPSVQYAESDHFNRYDIVPNDPLFSSQWGLTQAQLPSAWSVTQGSVGRFIAILDSGIYDEASTFPAPDGGAGHPDLRGKVAVNVNFSDEPDTDDYADHGTLVAGLAAASTNNGIGIAGTGYLTRLFNVKVGDVNGVTESAAIAGLHWAADNGASVANMSFGGEGACDSAFQDAVNYAWARGVVIVAAAGNDADSNVHSPASCTNVLAVASVTNSDTRSSFSSFGSWVQLAAAGGSADNVNPDIVSTNDVGTYSTEAGTSFSAPLVSGVAALVWTTSYGISAQAVVNRLEQTADKIAGTGTLWVYGRVNAFQAVAQPTCTARPVTVSANPGTPGTLVVTVAASGFDVYLVSLQFSNPQTTPSSPVNALINIGSLTNQTGGIIYNPPLGTTTLTFTVVRAAAGATHVPFIVTSSCGSWPTFVGGGASAF